MKESYFIVTEEEKRWISHRYPDFDIKENKMTGRITFNIVNDKRERVCDSYLIEVNLKKIKETKSMLPKVFCIDNKIKEIAQELKVEL